MPLLDPDREYESRSSHLSESGSSPDPKYGILGCYFLLNAANQEFNTKIGD